MHLNYAIKQVYADLTKEHRLDVLTFLMLHCNVRNRCWLRIETIAKACTSNNKNAATRARNWLEAHGAIERVPYKKRVDDELEPPARQIVYQLTGVLKLETNGKPAVIPFLFLSESIKCDSIKYDTLSSSSLKSIADKPQAADKPSKQQRDEMFDAIRNNAYPKELTESMRARIGRAVTALLKDGLEGKEVDKAYQWKKDTAPHITLPRDAGKIATMVMECREATTSGGDSNGRQGML